MSSGQVHFFLDNRHAFFNDEDECYLAEQLTRLLIERFRWEPYHLQLVILDACHFVHDAPAELTQHLVDAINALDVSPSNWAINTCILDALKSLGALNDEGDHARKQIKQELAAVTGENEEPIYCSLALSLCLHMIDHPFDWIYGEEIYRLDEPCRRQLFRRAIGAPDINQYMSMAWLIHEVACFDDASDALLMRPLAKIPDASSSFPQEEWNRFVIATRFLGRHGADLPAGVEKDAMTHCLYCLQTLIYAAESQRQHDVNNADRAWETLHAVSPQLVIGCLSEVDASLRERHSVKKEQPYGPIDLSDVYPVDCLRVARRFVIDGIEAQYVHQYPARESGPAFAFRTIGNHGDQADLDNLRKLSHNYPFAKHALRAIKLLDQVGD